MASFLGGKRTLCLLVLVWFGPGATLGRRKKVSMCDSEPCQNGGWCIDLTSPTGEKKCSCREGYRGLTCQKKIDPCNEEPCLNEGTCTAKGESFHCTCQHGFQGKRCDKKKEIHEVCRGKPCGPHGICEAVNDDFVCECLPGHTGPRCQNAEKKSMSVVDVENEDSSLRAIVMVILVFVVVMVVVLVILGIHCTRVYTRRSELRSAQERRKNLGLEPNPIPGWMEVSNDLCRTCICCGSPPVLDEVTGVIVPVGEYHSMLNGHKGPTGNRKSQTRNVLELEQSTAGDGALVQPAMEDQVHTTMTPETFPPPPAVTVRPPSVRVPSVRQSALRPVSVRQTPVWQTPVWQAPVRHAPIRQTSVRQAPVRQASVRHPSGLQAPAIHPVYGEVHPHKSASIQWNPSTYETIETPDIPRPSMQPFRASQYRTSVPSDAIPRLSSRAERLSYQTPLRKLRSRPGIKPAEEYDFTDHHRIVNLQDAKFSNPPEEDEREFGHFVLSRRDLQRLQHPRQQPFPSSALKKRSKLARDSGVWRWKQPYIQGEEGDGDEEQRLLGMADEYYDEDEEDELLGKYARGDLREYYQESADEEEDGVDSEGDSGQSDHDFQGPSDDGYGSTTRFSENSPSYGRARTLLNRLPYARYPSNNALRSSRYDRLLDSYNRRRNAGDSSPQYSLVDSSEEEAPYVKSFIRDQARWKRPAFRHQKDFSIPSATTELDSDVYPKIKRGDLMAGHKKTGRKKKSPPKIEFRRKGILKKKSSYPTAYNNSTQNRTVHPNAVPCY